MENSLIIHIPWEIGAIRIMRAPVPKEAAFILMAMQVLEVFDKFYDIDKLIEMLNQKGFAVSVENGIIHDSDSDWIVVPESKVINL